MDMTLSVSNCRRRRRWGRWWAGGGQRGRQGRRETRRQGEILGIIGIIGNREAEQEWEPAAFAPLSIYFGFAQKRSARRPCIPLGIYLSFYLIYKPNIRWPTVQSRSVVAARSKYGQM